MSRSKIVTRLRRAAERYEQSRAARDLAIRDAKDAGLTYHEIAQEVGLGKSRVHQIVVETEQP